MGFSAEEPVFISQIPCFHQKNLTEAGNGFHSIFCEIAFIFFHSFIIRLEQPCHFVIHFCAFPPAEPVVADTKLYAGKIAITFLLHERAAFRPFFSTQGVFIPESRLFPILPHKEMPAQSTA